MSKKIILVDDHQLILDGLRQLLSTLPNLEIIAEANNGQQAIQLCEHILPDLVLMDIDMPVMNGLEATQLLKKKYPELKIIILTMHDEPSLIKKIIDIKAEAYLLKNADQSALLNGIQQVLDGKKYYSEDLLESIAKDKSITSSFSLRPSDAVLVAQLTEREIEIIAFIAEGLSNKDIADRLFISHRTVDTHRTNLMRKLDIHNIAGIIRFAIQNGISNSN